MLYILTILLFFFQNPSRCAKSSMYICKTAHISSFFWIDDLFSHEKYRFQTIGSFYISQKNSRCISMKLNSVLVKAIFGTIARPNYQTQKSETDLKLKINPILTRSIGPLCLKSQIEARTLKSIYQFRFSSPQIS